MIYNLSGLKKLHGPAFSLRNLYLHGNQLTSLDHVISCLIGCRMLKELTMSQYGEANPMCEISAYRSSVLAALKTLEVLDGLDRAGKPAATRDNVFMGTILLFFLSILLKLLSFFPIYHCYPIGQRRGGSSRDSRASRHDQGKQGIYNVHDCIFLFSLSLSPYCPVCSVSTHTPVHLGSVVKKVFFCCKCCKCFVE